MKKNIISLGDAIQKIINDIKPPTDSYFNLIKNNWSSIVGDNIAKNTTPLKIENSILIVKVNSHIWKNELNSGLGNSILFKIKKNFAKNISKIRWI